MNWLPIETAPKDGTEILVMDGVYGVHGAVWKHHRGKTDWFHHCNLGWIPSARYWMPLPPAPTNKSPHVQPIKELDQGGSQLPSPAAWIHVTGIGRNSLTTPKQTNNEQVPLWTTPQLTPEVEEQAAMYQWLRNNLDNDQALEELYKHGGDAPTPEEFDAAVRAAMKSPPRTTT
jgi:hypothetical protein